MRKEDVLEVVCGQVLEILPGVDRARFFAARTLTELGADSMDRAEIVTGAQEALGVIVPIEDLAAAKDIASLVEVLFEVRSGAR